MIETHVRLTEEQHAAMVAETKRLGLRGQAEFVRLAVTWYLAWLAAVRETGENVAPEPPDPTTVTPPRRSRRKPE